jgi:hypothetical protein
MIRSRDHAWSFHRQFFSNRLISFFDEWRMLILDYRMTYVCFRFVERRLWWNVKLDETFHQIWSETTRQTWRKRLIKLDESDSSNLTKKASSHQTWWKRHLIKFNESVISSNLTRTSSHQIWRESHLIKFLKRETIFLLFDEQFCSDIWCEKLSLAKNHLLCEDCCDKWAFLMKTKRWYNSAFFYKRRASSYVKTMNNCRRSDNSNS